MAVAEFEAGCSVAEVVTVGESFDGFEAVGALEGWEDPVDVVGAVGAVLQYCG